MKKNNQTIFDTLINIMPELKSKLQNKDFIDPKLSSDLFLIWKTAQRVKKDTFRKPVTISIGIIKNLKRAGLINFYNNNIELTDKGKEIIKVMVLGDDRSIFEDSEVIIDYNNALSNIKNVKTATKKNMTK